MATPKAAILSMGDELTLGQTLNSNSRWLAQRLLECAIVPVEHVTVPDDLDHTVRTLTRLAAEVDVIISTGGLGPTADDLCREALSRAMGSPLVEDGASLEQIKRYFKQRAREMPPANAVQALRPETAHAIRNDFGTAPGLVGAIGRCPVFCLPGPPREMMPMFENAVVPRLPASGVTVRTRVLHTVGLGESDIAGRLGQLMDRSRNPLVGTTASGGIVSVRIRYEGPGPAATADGAVAETEKAVRAAVGDYVFGAGDQSLADAISTKLLDARASLCVVESCTGGLLGAMLTEVPGISRVLAGGWVTYSNTMKYQQVGVPPEVVQEFGAVSGECARAMAEGGLRSAGTDFCLSITGVAGPDGGTPEKPVGTVWIGVAWRDARREVHSEGRHFKMSGGRAEVREWSARSALALLYYRLVGRPQTRLLREI